MHLLIISKLAFPKNHGGEMILLLAGLAIKLSIWIFFIFAPRSSQYLCAMQTTVQDREVQCAEGDPCWVQEWCSKEGIHCCLRFWKPQIIRFWCPILYCYLICTRIFDWKYREKLKSKSGWIQQYCQDKKGSVILCCECFVSVRRSFLLLVAIMRAFSCSV